MSGKFITVVVRSHQGTEFSGQATAVTGHNSKGVFDVLPNHSNFITVITKKLTVHLPNGTKKEMNLESGVMRVLTGSVEVFLGVESVHGA